MVRAFADPVIWLLQTISNAIDWVVSGLWDNLAKPVLDFLGAAALQEARRHGEPDLKGDDGAGPVARHVRVGVAEGDVRSRLERRGRCWTRYAGAAKGLWEGFAKTFEPIKKPLMAIGGVLVLLSPLGPIVVLTEVISPVWAKLSWLWENFNRDDVIAWGHAILREDILPGILGSVGGVAAALSGATGWLAGVLVGLAAAVAGGAGRVRREPLPDGGDTLPARHLRPVSAAFPMGTRGFAGLAAALYAVFDALTAILQPILDFCVRLGMVAVNPWLLPTALEAAIWLLCPEDLKAEVINLVLELLIAGLNAFPALFLGLGPSGSSSRPACSASWSTCATART